MHTTASDGRLSPAELVVRAATAGLTTIAVTDHDTVAAVAETTAIAAAAGIRVVPGIEITSVEDHRDVHVLGYFFDPASERLAAFLVGQRERRVTRVREMAERLAAANLFIDVDRLLKTAAERPGSSVGRPQIAREMVRAGHVPSVQAAVELWLAAGRPAFVPRSGPDAAAVIAIIHGAGGVASFAHPGVTRRDDLIAPLADRGLDAIEVYHSDHTQEDTTAYRRLAARHGLLVSGGSDFHGDDPSMADSPSGKAAVDKRARRGIFGAVGLPPSDFLALEQRSRVAH